MRTIQMIGCTISLSKSHRSWTSECLCWVKSKRRCAVQLTWFLFLHKQLTSSLQRRDSQRLTGWANSVLLLPRRRDTMEIRMLLRCRMLRRRFRFEGSILWSSENQVPKTKAISELALSELLVVRLLLWDSRSTMESILSSRRRKKTMWILTEMNLRVAIAAAAVDWCAKCARSSTSPSAKSIGWRRRIRRNSRCSRRSCPTLRRRRGFSDSWGSCCSCSECTLCFRPCIRCCTGSPWLDAILARLAASFVDSLASWSPSPSGC